MSVHAAPRLGCQLWRSVRNQQHHKIAVDSTKFPRAKNFLNLPRLNMNDIDGSTHYVSIQTVVKIDLPRLNNNSIDGFNLYN